MLQMEQLDCGFDSHALPDHSLPSGSAPSTQGGESWPGNSAGNPSHSELAGEASLDSQSEPERGVVRVKDMQASAAAVVADRLRATQTSAGGAPPRASAGPLAAQLWQPMSMHPSPLQRGMSSQDGQSGAQPAQVGHDVGQRLDVQTLKTLSDAEKIGCFEGVCQTWLACSQAGALESPMCGDVWSMFAAHSTRVVPVFHLVRLQRLIVQV